MESTRLKTSHTDMSDLQFLLRLSLLEGELHQLAKNADDSKRKTMLLYCARLVRLTARR